MAYTYQNYLKNRMMDQIAQINSMLYGTADLPSKGVKGMFSAV
jgi:hypothetical protein